MPQTNRLVRVRHSAHLGRYRSLGFVDPALANRSRPARRQPHAALAKEIDDVAGDKLRDAANGDARGMRQTQTQMQSSASASGATLTSFALQLQSAQRNRDIRSNQSAWDEILAAQTQTKREAEAQEDFERKRLQCEKKFREQYESGLFLGAMTTADQFSKVKACILTTEANPRQLDKVNKLLDKSRGRHMQDLPGFIARTRPLEECADEVLQEGAAKHSGVSEWALKLRTEKAANVAVVDEAGIQDAAKRAHGRAAVAAGARRRVQRAQGEATLDPKAVRAFRERMRELPEALTGMTVKELEKEIVKKTRCQEVFPEEIRASIQAISGAKNEVGQARAALAVGEKMCAFLQDNGLARAAAAREAQTMQDMLQKIEATLVVEEEGSAQHLALPAVDGHLASSVVRSTLAALRHAAAPELPLPALRPDSAALRATLPSLTPGPVKATADSTAFLPFALRGQPRASRWQLPLTGPSNLPPAAAAGLGPARPLDRLF